MLDLGLYACASTLHELKGECKAGRRPPLTTAEFNQQLEAKSFTSRSADLEAVQGLYKRAYESRLGSVTELWLRQLGWTDVDCELLCAVIASSVLKELQLLVLNENDLGDSSATALAAILSARALPKLKELSIYGNPRLSDSGVSELQAVCDQMGVGLISIDADKLSRQLELADCS